MTELIANVENTPTSQSLCELQLWKPAQGSIAEALPISIDLDFDSEVVSYPNASFQIQACRATVQLRTIGADVVRGSRLGEYVLDPSMTAEVTQSVRVAIETETDATGHLEVDVKPNFFGRLMGAVSWKRRKTKKAEHDHVVNAVMRIARVIPRTSGRWTIVEPVTPNTLTGRFIGTVGDDEVGPLCLLTMREPKCTVQVIVTVARDDFVVRQTNPDLKFTRNREAILSQMVSRSLASSQVTNFALPPGVSHSEIVLARSVMEVCFADT